MDAIMDMFYFYASFCSICNLLIDIFLSRNKLGERVFVAVADEKTAHIANLVSKQKGKRKKVNFVYFFFIIFNIKVA